jgi:hypothetical protein
MITIKEYKGIPVGTVLVKKDDVYIPQLKGQIVRLHKTEVEGSEYFGEVQDRIESEKVEVVLTKPVKKTAGRPKKK